MQLSKKLVKQVILGHCEPIVEDMTLDGSYALQFIDYETQLSYKGLDAIEKLAESIMEIING